jgi:uncharacterized membrane protein
VQDAVSPRSSLQSTPFDEEASSRESHRPEGLGAVVGTSVLALTAAGLLAYAVRERSWRSLAVAVAGAPLVYRGATGRWPMPRTLAARRAQTAQIESSIIINRPAAELYQEWRNLSNLPRFMRNLESVVETGNGRSHWVARTPIGGALEWDAEIVDERPGRLLSWRSLPGSAVDNAGSVLFEEHPTGRGTVVHVSMELAPHGPLAAVASLVQQVPELQVKEDLRRFKNLMEAGEIPTTEGQPHGERGAVDIENPL